MKTTICLTSLLLALALPVPAALYNSGALNVLIPDDNTLGTGNLLQFNVSGEASSLSALTLTFLLQDGYSTDLSGYLRLGNEISSPAYTLTSLIHSQTLSPGSPTTYTIDFSNSGFESTFTALNPNNTWTLYFQDGIVGDEALVKGWSLDITAVPEPVNVALGLFGVVLVGAGVRQYWRTRRAQA